MMKLFEKHPELYMIVIPAITVPIMLGVTLLVM
jgi:hypothetical protein